MQRGDQRLSHRRLGVPSNLPEELSSFVGRAGHVARGLGLLDRTRSLTVSGPGGAGKTRLARRIVAGAAASHPDGVWWVELATARDRAQVEDAIARAMGLPVPATTPDRRVEVLADHLGDQRVLIALDNCEHLLTEVAGVADTLLRAAPGLGVLATSREGLGVEGEIVWRLPPLEVPPEDADDVADYDAVRLFVERADPDFHLTAEVAPTVAAICRALDGMPLALELAAARTGALSAAGILAALDDRFRFLTGGPRPAPERLRSLRASIAWSHDLCTDAEQVLLRRLAAFAGDFDADAAAAVAGFAPLAPTEVLDALAGLVAKSLVQVQAGPAAGRYRLLETVRVASADRLAEAGEVDALADRHLAWTVELAASLEGPTARCEVDALDRLEDALPDLRAALAHATRSPSSHDGLRLIAALGYFWARRGLGIAGTDLGEAAVAADAGAPPSLLAPALRAIAYARLYGGCFPTAAETAGRALAAAVEAGDRIGQARCQVVLGGLAAFSDTTQARALCLEALATAEALGDRWCQTEALGLISFSYQVDHRPVGARPYEERATALSTAEHDRFGLVWAHLYAGMAGQVAGRYAASREAYTHGIRAADEVGDPLLLLYGYAGLTNVALAEGRWSELAVVAAGMNRPELRFAELTLAFAEALRGIARVADDPGVGVAALIAGGAGITPYVPFAGPRFVLMGARHALARGDVATAEKAASETLDGHRAAGSALAGACAVLLARVRRRQGETLADLAHDGLAQIVDAELWTDLPEALQVVAGLTLDAGRPAEATRLLAAADALDNRLGRHDVLAAEVAADRDRAALALGDAFDDVWAEGAALDLAGAVAYARRARGPRGRPRSGWDALSPTELEVVRLAAEGCSNPAIAGRLFVTRATVKTHLVHVFAKLGVTSRAELAAEAVRHGLT